jgi:acetylornithine/N-succinyldiaminopimelate aminotransferase
MCRTSMAARRASAGAALVDNCFADTVFFTNSGAEAVECAIKTARRYHYVNGNPITRQADHLQQRLPRPDAGRRSATNQPKMREGFEPLLPGFAYAPFNDLEAALALIDENTAGFLVETVQGEGGMTAGTQEFIQACARRATSMACC